MVALSSLPLDYFPGLNALNTTITRDKDRDRRSSQDETVELEVDIEVYNQIASCNATSPSKGNLLFLCFIVRVEYRFCFMFHTFQLTTSRNSLKSCFICVSISVFTALYCLSKTN